MKVSNYNIAIAYLVHDESSKIIDQPTTHLCGAFVSIQEPFARELLKWQPAWLLTCSNPGQTMSEGCFIFHFARLPLEFARPI